MPGVTMTTPYGTYTELALSSAAVIATGRRILARLMVASPGDGTLTVNDCATLETAASANQIISVAPSAGQVIELDWPCDAGITLSSVPAGASVGIAYS